MNLSKNVILGLDKQDNEIVSFLRKSEWSTVSVISRNVKCPRTSIEYKLKKLQERGLAVDRKSGKERYWSISPYDEIQFQNKNEISTISGIVNILNHFHEIIKPKSKSRIFAIEPKHQVQEYYKKVNPKKHIQISKDFKLADHIAESIITESTLEILTKLEKEQLKEMFGRATILTSVKDDLLTVNSYTILYENKVYFIDFKKESMQIINNKDFYVNFKSFFDNLQILGTRVNLNEYILRIINNASNQSQKSVAKV